MQRLSRGAIDAARVQLKARVAGLLAPAPFPDSGQPSAPRRRKPPKFSAAMLCRLCHAKGLKGPVAEYRFDRVAIGKPRGWRFDFAWPESKVALEVEGGVWTEGRHVRGAGFVEDMEKYNRAAVLGWRIVRVLPEQVETPSTLCMIAALLRAG